MPQIGAETEVEKPGGQGQGQCAIQLSSLSPTAWALEEPTLWGSLNLPPEAVGGQKKSLASYILLLFNSIQRYNYNTQWYFLV